MALLAVQASLACTLAAACAVPVQDMHEVCRAHRGADARPALHGGPGGQGATRCHPPRPHTPPAQDTCCTVRLPRTHHAPDTRPPTARATRLRPGVCARQVFELLKLWMDLQKTLPDAVLVFRNGLSEGQFQPALDSELAQIEQVRSPVQKRLSLGQRARGGRRARHCERASGDAVRGMRHACTRRRSSASRARTGSTRPRSRSAACSAGTTRASTPVRAPLAWDARCPAHEGGKRQRGRAHVRARPCLLVPVCVQTTRTPTTSRWAAAAATCARAWWWTRTFAPRASLSSTSTRTPVRHDERARGRAWAPAAAAAVGHGARRPSAQLHRALGRARACRCAGLQGTNRPAKYTVLHDTVGFSSDSFQVRREGAERNGWPRAPHDGPGARWRLGAQHTPSLSCVLAARRCWRTGSRTRLPAAPGERAPAGLRSCRAQPLAAGRSDAGVHCGS